MMNSERPRAVSRGILETARRFAADRDCFNLLVDTLEGWAVRVATSGTAFLDVHASLAVSCGPVTLVVPSLQQIVALARFVHDGLFADGQPSTLGGWYDPSRPVFTARSTIELQMSAWMRGRSSRVELPFAVLVDKQVVGIQGLTETHAGPYRLSREFGTGSWLAPMNRGKGLATPARWCALHVAFAGLDAQSVVSSALVGNVPSQRVSEKCGYLPDGLMVDTSRGLREELVRFRMTRDRWLDLERSDVVAQGLDGLRSAVLGDD